ncbi:unnamed protein product [Urochloa humidicola]
MDQAFDRVFLSGADPRPLVAQKLRPKDASPLLKMMAAAAGVAAAGAGAGAAAGAAAAGGQQAWVLLNPGPVQAMANAADILKIVVDTVFPKLYARPCSNAILHALSLFAGTLRDEAPVVGGSFQVILVAAAASIDGYVVKAQAHVLHAPYTELREAMKELEDHFRAVPDRVYTLRH